MTALRYFAAVRAPFCTVMEEQGENIRAAGAAVNAGGKARATHSFRVRRSRAGRAASVVRVLVPELMLHEGLCKSLLLECFLGFAACCLTEDLGLGPQDVALVFSNSERNAVPIEVALLFLEPGIKVIAVTSLRHSLAVPASPFGAVPVPGSLTTAV